MMTSSSIKPSQSVVVAADPFGASSNFGLKMKRLDGENPLSLLLKAVSQRSVGLEDCSKNDSDKDTPMEKSKFPFKKNKLLGLNVDGKKQGKAPASVRPLKKSTLNALRTVIADHSRSVQLRRSAGTGSVGSGASIDDRRVSLLSSITQARAILDRNMERTGAAKHAAKEAQGPVSATKSAPVSNQGTMIQWNNQVEQMLLRHSERRRQMKLQELKMIEEARQKEQLARASAVAAVLGAAAVRDAAVEKLVHARQSAQFQSNVEQMIMRHVARRKMAVPRPSAQL
jgi:hypothetical protein